MNLLSDVFGQGGEREIIEREFGQIPQVSETGGQTLQRIVTNIEHLQILTVPNTVRYFLNVVSVAVELDQIDKVADLGRQALDLVVTDVELVQLRELVEALGKLVELIRVEQELL
jgi:hypothetical protein